MPNPGRDNRLWLYYFNARWYDPILGRFISEDPAQDGTNFYSYAANSPLNFVDPWGLDVGNPGNDGYDKDGNPARLDKADPYDTTTDKDGNTTITEHWHTGNATNATQAASMEAHSYVYHTDKIDDYHYEKYLTHVGSKSWDTKTDPFKMPNASAGGDAPDVGTVAGSLAAGAWEGIKGPVAGAVNAAKNPAATWNAAKAYFSNFPASVAGSAQRLYDAYVDGTPEDQLRMVGSLIPGAALAISTAGLSAYLDALSASGEAASAADALRLGNRLAAEEVTGGHAFGKHAYELGVNSQLDFKLLAEGMLNDSSTIMRTLTNGRAAYWNSKLGAVLIRNPSAADGGTFFVPKNGIDYFLGLK